MRSLEFKHHSRPQLSSPGSERASDLALRYCRPAANEHWTGLAMRGHPFQGPCSFLRELLADAGLRSSPRGVGPMSRMVAVVLPLLLFASGALAAPSVRIEDLTWTELQAAIRAGSTTIIIPIGGTRAERTGNRARQTQRPCRGAVYPIATILGNTLVAPVIAYVPEGDVSRPSGHLAFPGTITIPDAVFETLIEYAARSFRLAVFRDIVPSRRPRRLPSRPRLASCCQRSPGIFAAGSPCRRRPRRG